MGAIRVAIVADDQLFRDGLHQILRRDPSLLIIDDGDRVFNRGGADIRLVDARLTESIAEDTMRNDGRPHIIAVNVPDDDVWAADALSAGVRGVLARSAGADDLVKAIRVVHEGGIWARRRWLIACVKRSVGSLGARDERSAAKTSLNVDGRLSRREWEVYRHAATGVSNKELADRLAISEATVKAHMTRIFQKLGVTGRAALVAAYYARAIEPETVVRPSA